MNDPGEDGQESPDLALAGNLGSNVPESPQTQEGLRGTGMTILKAQAETVKPQTFLGKRKMGKWGCWEENEWTWVGVERGEKLPWTGRQVSPPSDLSGPLSRACELGSNRSVCHLGEAGSGE